MTESDSEMDDLDLKPELVVVDGEQETPVNAYALCVALFAVVPDAMKGTVITTALALTEQLAKGRTIQIRTNRVATTSGPLVQP